MGVKAMATPLTDRQRQVLEHIATSIRRNGIVPSVREIGHALGMRSRHQAIHDVVGVRDRAPEGVGYGDEASVAVIGHPLDGTERIGDRDQTIEIVVAERRRPAARIGLAGEP